MLTTSFGESESMSHFIICLWYSKLSCALSSLTLHSAEVNIGIAAACLPTLLPLYRLLRDRINAARKDSTSTTGQFRQVFFGQGRKANASSLKPILKSRKEDEFSVPPNAEWASSTPLAFTRIGRAGDEDVEMQTPIVKSHHLPRRQFE